MTNHASLLAQEICDMGYSAMDIITTLFRVVKTFPDKDMPEYLKLEFIRVSFQMLPQLSLC